MGHAFWKPPLNPGLVLMLSFSVRSPTPETQKRVLDRALHFAIWLASTSIPGEENVNYCEEWPWEFVK